MVLTKQKLKALFSHVVAALGMRRTEGTAKCRGFISRHLFKFQKVSYKIGFLASKKDINT